nr:S8 family peptidase [Kibdelosporangium sp. MJ126-NF4]CEL13703.1 peptidase S8 and S53, subtilisin, kexin, sedolisin [Kibdelosporangium sp. MJ126-NF4]CTQ99389.1 peptidase S8 and S53, subtilisin, kexin, sedolisin [Kibdelosporangium sp. MJ126-NF4]
MERTDFRLRRLLVVVALLPVALPLAAANPVTAVPDTALPRIQKHHQVTLLTGDRVDYIESGDGSRAARIDADPAPDRPAVSFETLSTPGGVFVFPSDAMPLVSAGIVDRSLFNVTKLAREGDTEQLPLFVRYRNAMAATAALPQAVRRAVVPTLNGEGVRVATAKAGETWRSVKARPGDFAGLSLDPKVRVSLDRSTEQVGAPVMWQSGVDGKGTTVAVVDTGIDADHPDLKGKIVDSANFTAEPDIADTHGHGTHVASIIAGTGLASGGRYRGVAPAASLLVAKVFDSSGEASAAQVMAGMEWAAQHGAKVVNLSLGGPVPDGTDEMSELVDTLTERTGALFVVAAGNSGPGAVSVDSPGVAASALTVGAVDRQDKLAGFSSRGPRGKDALAKPEIVAPGVDIAAARAAGTSMGRPVDETYTAASGTSMATPHVSGAAALLAQKYPQWSASRLKDALAGGAKDIGQDWYGQGTGRLDVAGVAATPVFAPASANLGAGEQTLRYTNETNAPVALSLTASIRSWTGKPVAPGAVRFSQNAITVPANGSTSVTVTFQATDTGAYGGTIVASNSTIARRTTVSRYAPPELVPVTVRVLDSAGQPRAASLAALMDDAGTSSNANDPFRRDPVTFLTIGASGTTTVDVPRGVYSVLATTSQSDLTARRWNALSASEVPVQGPTVITLDERATVPVGVTGTVPLDQRDRTVMVRRVVPGLITEFGLAAGATSWQVRATPARAAKRGAITSQDLQSLQPAAVQASVGTVPLRPEYDAFGIATKWPGTHEVGVTGYDPKADMRGKAVLVPVQASQAPAAFTAATQAANTAAAAGATAVLVYVTTPGAVPIPGLSSDTVPVLALTRDEGEQVSAMISGGAATLKATVAAQPTEAYNVSYLNPNGIPADSLRRLDRSALVAVGTSYHADKPGLTAQKTWYAVPTGLWKTQFLRGTRFTVPATVRELTGPVDDRTVWKRSLTQSGKDALGRLGSLTMFQQNTYRQGETTRPPEKWFAAPLHTGAVELQPDHPARYPATAAGWQEICSMCRGGADPDLFVPPLQWGDSTPGHYTSPWQVGRHAAASTTRLYAGDTEIPPANSGDPTALFPVYRLDPALARYRLQAVDTHPAAGQSGVPNGAVFRLATMVDTVWSFQSRRATAPPPTGFLCYGQGPTCSFQPLIQLGYDFGLDVANQVQAGVSHTFTVTAAEHSGARDGGPVVGVQLSYSTDDGVTWRQGTATPQNNGRWSVTVPLPPLADTNGYVWTRTEARDSSGNTVTQTVRRAYALK